MVMEFHNTYYLQRHGRSLANEAGLVVSTKENGTSEKWTLAELGRQQAIEGGKQLRQMLEQDGKTQQPLLVWASPFSRTQLTARLSVSQVDESLVDQVQSDDALVERGFGSCNELKPYADVYKTTWEHDAESFDYRPGGDGETVNEVVARLRGLFERIEAQHQGRNVLLVAHGDTLSICQAAFTPGGDLAHHEATCAFTTGQVKRLN